MHDEIDRIGRFKDATATGRKAELTVAALSTVYAPRSCLPAELL